MSPPRRFLLVVLLMAAVCVPASAVAYMYTTSESYLDGDEYDVWAWAYAWVNPYECQYAYHVEAEAVLDWSLGAGDEASGASWSVDLEVGASNVEPGSSYSTDAAAVFYVQECPWPWMPHEATDYQNWWIDSRPIPGSLNPSEGEPGNSGEMDISGDNMGFDGTSVAVASGSCGISFDAVSSNSRYGLSVPYEISFSGTQASTCDISVSNEFGASYAEPTFTTRVYAPEIQELSPSSAQKGAQGMLTIYGDHFYSEAGMSTDCAMTFGSPTVQDNNTIQVSYSISPSAPAGQCTVEVGNRKGWTTGEDNFTITQ